MQMEADAAHGNAHAAMTQLENFRGNEEALHSRLSTKDSLIAEASHAREAEEENGPCQTLQ
jgi:hypothetical protein